jgi:hypothetical protein
MNINEKRKNLYDEIQKHFNGELTKDGIIVIIDGQKVAIKVTMKKNFDEQKERLGEFQSYVIPYDNTREEELEELCSCIRQFYKLDANEKIIGSRYWRDYHGLLNHNQIPKNLIPSHLWKILPEEFKQIIIEKFGEWSNDSNAKRN